MTTAGCPVGRDPGNIVPDAQKAVHHPSESPQAFHARNHHHFSLVRTHYLNRILPFMSHTHATTSSSLASSSNFQMIINNALDEYKKRTKSDLLAHPLAIQLQACHSSGAILAVLQQQVRELDQSRSSDERWSRWLDPTVYVLYSLSSTLGAGVGLVCLRI